MKLKYLGLLAIGFILNVCAFAQAPKVPFSDAGACPFECCTYRQWIANKDTIIYRQMRDGSPIAFRVKKKEKVRGLTGVVITTKAGQVKALKDFVTETEKVSIKAGDIFYLLTYRGEGFFVISYKGKRFEDSVTDEDKIKVLNQPVSIWWVKIRNSKGQIGWTKLNENFDNMDACG
jgi:hypothetical protein